MLDQEVLVNSIESYLNDLKSTVKWLLGIFLIIAWSVFITRSETIVIFDIPIANEFIAYVGAASILAGSIYILDRFSSLLSLLKQIEKPNQSKAITILLTHRWFFNPFYIRKLNLGLIYTSLKGMMNSTLFILLFLIVTALFMNGNYCTGAIGTGQNIVLLICMIFAYSPQIVVEKIFNYIRENKNAEKYSANIGRIAIHYKIGIYASLVLLLLTVLIIYIQMPVCQ